jgi:hypothetical protein
MVWLNAASRAVEAAKSCWLMVKTVWPWIYAFDW